MDDPLIIGLGNRYRGDDAAGLEAARLIADHRPELRVLAHEREPSDLLDLWAGCHSCTLIDAVAGAEPGRVHRFDASNAALPVAFASAASTHALALGDVIELGRSLGRLPNRLIVFGIEGVEFAAGAQLGSAVRRAAERVADLVLGELASER
jgi:hydrogenase maturation protease